MASLKEQYGEREWVESSAREYHVLAWLSSRLLRAFDSHVAYVRLTGLGAGRGEYVEGRYTRPEDAFDITVYIDGRPCCWVEVTGKNRWSDLKGYDGDKARVPLCVGTWKLRKAKELGVLDRVWFAFVILETKTIKAAHARYLYSLAQAEAPWVHRMKLRVEERDSVCLPAMHWKKPTVMVKWIQTRGLVYAAQGV